MTVLIKGMEMPKRCFDCWALDEYSDYPFCRITNEQRGYNFRMKEQKMDKCPLVEVPTSHGRLIDADKLMKVVYSELSYGEEALWAMIFCDEFIGPAPTAIEAEG